MIENALIYSPVTSHSFVQYDETMVNSCWRKTAIVYLQRLPCWALVRGKILEEEKFSELSLMKQMVWKIHLLANLQSFHCTYRHWRGKIWQIAHHSWNLLKFSSLQFFHAWCMLNQINTSCEFSKEKLNTRHKWRRQDLCSKLENDDRLCDVVYIYTFILIFLLLQ